MHKKKLINLIENKFKEEFYAVPIGTIFSFASTNPPPGAFVLNGQIISNCQTLFPDFWNWFMEENANGTIRIISASNYESEQSSIGMCGGFVVDSENGSVRLPNISNGFIEGSNGNNVGNTIDAGLPNITGAINNGGNFYTYATANGAFTLNGSTSPVQIASEYMNGGEKYPNIRFDASRSSSVYGSSNTVQPKSICYQFCIQVYNSTSKLSTAIASQIISELQGKAGINLENLSINGKQQILNTAFEISSASSRKYLTANTIYQAEKTSLLWIRYTKSASGQVFYVMIGETYSNETIGNAYTYAPGSDAADFYIIIPKNYYIKVNANSNITFSTLCFIPLKDSN